MWLQLICLTIIAHVELRNLRPRSLALASKTSGDLKKTQLSGFSDFSLFYLTERLGWNREEWLPLNDKKGTDTMGTEVLLLGQGELGSSFLKATYDTVVKRIIRTAI